MAESNRLRILKALTAHLEGINGIDPYEFNLTGHIKRGRDRYGATDPLPLISILEGKAANYGQFADERNLIRLDSWLLMLQGWVEDDPLNPTDPAYSLLADVELRLSDIVATDGHGRPKFPGIFMLGGLISSLTVAQPVVRPPEDGLSSKAFFYLPVLVGLKSDLSKPQGGR
jgi:hypothetical protein